MSQKWSNVGQWQQYTVFGSTVITAILGYVSSHFLHDPLLTSIFVGALGGIVHEIAQSNGKLMFPQAASDGIYLGGTYGLLVGGISGLILAQGQPVLSPGTAFPSSLIGEAFLAGLSLKGLSEAVTAQNPTTISSKVIPASLSVQSLGGQASASLRTAGQGSTQDMTPLSPGVGEANLIAPAPSEALAVKSPGSQYRRLDWSRNR